MKYISLFFVLFFGSTIQAQDIVGLWKTNELFTYKVKEEYVMTLVKLNDDGMYGDLYGNFTQFREDGRFISHNGAPCGNDCFTSSEGAFTYKGQNQVVLTIQQMYQDGTCTSSRVETVELGIFDIQRSGENLVLVKHK